MLQDSPSRFREVLKKAAAIAIATLPWIAGITTMHAGTITISGQIMQSGLDPIAGAASIRSDSDEITLPVSYTLSSTIGEPFSGTGTFSLTGTSLIVDPGAQDAVETPFDFATLQITEFDTFDVFSLFACPTGGFGCIEGNTLELDFLLSPDSLRGQNVTPDPIFGHPAFNRFEGATVFTGSATSYSYQTLDSAPEPCSFGLGAVALLAIAAKLRRRV